MSLLPEALEEASPAQRTSIDVEDFQNAADAFALQQASVAGIVRTLNNGLDTNSACIGRDKSGQYFAASYRSAAETVLKGLAALHDVLGPIAEGLAKAGTDHSRADAISAADWRTTAYTTVTPNYDIVGSAAPPSGTPSVPDITGHEPGWLPSQLDDIWPCADNGTLGALAGVWDAARNAVADTRTDLNNALNALTGNNEGEDIEALDGFWQELVGDNVSIFPALDNAMKAIGDALGAYGTMIDNFQDALDNAVVDAVTTAAGEAALAIIADIVTEGVGAAFTSAEAAAIIAEAATTIGKVCDDVLNALRVSTAIQDIDVSGAATVDLSSAIQYLPQPDVATRETWQGADDIAPQGSFNPDETAISAYLRTNNHVVTSINENHGKTNGRNTDALVDGQPVEFKTISPGTGLTSIGNDLKKSQSRRGQSSEILIDARNTTPAPGGGPVFSKSVVENELERFFTGQKRRTNGTIERVTVLLPDGSKATWPPGYGGL